ncbi:MAG: Coenzyme F420 hydrogenase/dehydrogenase, beta subunit C-terminal domain [Bacteroides sp.]|nr:Coenzyme F420 hydrogenase/dehydrogenase, beta subunit C-terminal domain [Bacteroides sp.]MCM1378736.1 Coenzyme F420 hydrogenase/dehydrogenase, beta subunit C-terminal domain [Bacteroides sp.]MCM1445353.1 Coenzyme F420 hydrogenase/dehydrogenase, beta subunit C-terminal domain [Prevotella sp.]
MEPKFEYPSAAYALYTKDLNDRETCTSGGAATMFAREVIDRGGIVYGATAFGGYPHFVRINNAKGIESLKGSKYVYCDPEAIYKEIVEDLKQGHPCLFIGLPCNVGGLKKFLRKDYSNLITVDLVCHGTPPFEYLLQHAKSKIPSGSSIGNLIFRGKLDFHTQVCGNLIDPIYIKSQYEDEYLLGFMRGWIYRMSCYSCKFARPERCSDITIGDFWGLSSDAMGGYKGKKSLALINTPQGRAFFDAVSSRAVFEQRSVEEAVKGNPQLRHPTHYTESARIFHNVYSQTQSFKIAAKACGINKAIRFNIARRMVLAFPKWIRSLISKH